MSHGPCCVRRELRELARVARPSGDTPAPGLNTFTATSPMTSATVVASSNQTIAFRPMRPMAFRSPMPAMPITSVENSSGAMIILIIRRNASAMRLDAGPDVRQEVPERDPEHQADEDLRRGARPA